MKNSLNSSLVAVLALLAFGCASVEKVEQQAPADSPFVSSPAQKEPPIDVEKLQDELEMNRQADALGFEEKSFNACQLGLSKTNCKKQFFSVLHFQILCRNSTGTVQSLSQYELDAHKTDRLFWKVGLYNGRTRTDEEGYGQIRLVTPGSSSAQKLILKSGQQNLQLNYKEVRKIIVPDDWCRP